MCGSINWKFFGKYSFWSVLTLIVLKVISKIDMWVNQTEKSLFWEITTPFRNSVIFDLILLILILLIGLIVAYFKE